MKALSWLALVALVCAAGLGTAIALQTLVPGLPADLRGFSSAAMTIAATALVIDRITA
jgi:ABC-type proline/glycine betaine transport system permease subunit